MSQNELERRAGLSKGSVSSYISGRREQPRRDTMQKMAEALGVPVSRLADGDSVPVAPRRRERGMPPRDARSAAAQGPEPERDGDPGDWVSRVRFALQRSGLSMRALAERAGFSPTYVSALLRGEIAKRGPSADSLRRIALAAGVDQTWVITGVGQPGPAGETSGAALPARVSPEVDSFPARYRSLLAVGRRVDERVRDWLLSLNEGEHARWDERRWVEGAKRVHALLNEFDADPGLPPCREG